MPKNEAKPFFVQTICFSCSGDWKSNFVGWEGSQAQHYNNFMNLTPMLCLKRNVSCRLKDLQAKAPEELKAYCSCLDYYRLVSLPELSGQLFCSSSLVPPWGVQWHRFVDNEQFALLYPKNNVRISSASYCQQSQAISTCMLSKEPCAEVISWSFLSSLLFLHWPWSFWCSNKFEKCRKEQAAFEEKVPPTAVQ